MLNIIQLRSTFYNECGDKPFYGASTWQFNFKCSLIRLSIECCFDFTKFSKYGTCFHDSYDFAYLLKMIINEYLALNEVDFFETLKLFLPFVCDLTVLLHDIHGIKDGALQNHQAGSDSLSAGDVFFKMRYSFLEDLLDETKYTSTMYASDRSRNLPMRLAIMYHQCKDHTLKQTYDDTPLFYHYIAKECHRFG